MLYNLLKEGFGKDLDFNCAETILYGANEAYNLGFDRESLKLAAGFGGGMAIESVCCALTGAIMVLGRLFIKERAHESTRIKDLTKELLSTYEQEMGYIDCARLKDRYRTEELKCGLVIERAAKILDRIVERELGDLHVLAHKEGI